jgi:hypothetical protein
MSRQQAFEAIYAKQHDVPAESLVQYRLESKDGYSLPGIASHYRFYCLAMDSIVVELPAQSIYANTIGDHARGYSCAVDGIKESLTAAGVKYK